jgi:hypothetical protein
VALLRHSEIETFVGNVIVDGQAEGVYQEVDVGMDGNVLDRNAGGDWKTPQKAS